MAVLSLLASCDVKAAFQPSHAGSWPFSPASPCGARLGSVFVYPHDLSGFRVDSTGLFSSAPPPIQNFSGDLALFFGRGASDSSWCPPSLDPHLQLGLLRSRAWNCCFSLASLGERMGQRGLFPGQAGIT